MACPLRYRFRVIDQIPEPPNLAAVRGTLVHAVLERLFDSASEARTRARAAELVEPAWGRLRAADPEFAALFSSPEEERAWLAGARLLLETYFDLEDPARLEPVGRELHVVHETPWGVRLHGYLDRLDEAGDGALRVVDYKTGRSPRPGAPSTALFQLRFYALLLWRSRGVVPRELLVLYLGDGQSLRYSPDAEELERFERTLAALWEAMERARETGDWRPQPSKLCAWCEHKVRCPAFGGVPPALPAVDAPAVDGPAAMRDGQPPGAPD